MVGCAHASQLVSVRAPCWRRSHLSRRS